MFEFLDHESEAMVEVRAATVNGVFADAAHALFELMTDVSAITVVSHIDVELSAPERHFLLIDWLNRLILFHEVDKMFCSEFRVHVEQTAKMWSLRAILGCEPIREKHERRLHAKSATFGQFEWSEEPPGHRVRFVIDI